ncbi:dehydrogenase [Rhizodiscina lignyota]|uniref:Dehydrogenase n=1 Tax=Rhizodiscina lignyota TaxID=1504668 RepID=A0A9P4MAE5_9PEZI|nr:dehydrogenase [Rhizodiscina lignyota]
MGSPIQKSIRLLQSTYPWTSHPIVVGAPMRILSGPALAVAVSHAGGIGFIGPGAKPTDLEPALKQASSLISQSTHLSKHINKGSKLLPIGIGFQTWAGSLATAARILSDPSIQPAAVWLFAPRHGQNELDEWSEAICSASPDTQIWIQVASVSDALAAAHSSQKPDVLLPEVVDALSGSASTSSIPLVAAGGIIDSRGYAAALTLGASAATLGTRLLAASEAIINPGYQAHVLSATDGGQSTVRTQLYNHLRGTTDWPAPFDARGLINQSWRDHEAGVAFEKNKSLHDELLKKDGGKGAWGEQGRTATYAGTGIGLVRSVKPAGEVVEEVRAGVDKILEMAVQNAKL